MTKPPSRHVARRLELYSASRRNGGFVVKRHNTSRNAMCRSELFGLSSDNLIGASLVLPDGARSIVAIE